MLMTDDIELIKCLIKQQYLEMQREQLNKNAVEKFEEGTFDNVTGPAHYLADREYEPRKVIEDWDLGFYLGNTVKYISRAGRKNDLLEDLKKARQYLDWEIEKIEKKRSEEES